MTSTLKQMTKRQASNLLGVLGLNLRTESSASADRAKLARQRFADHGCLLHQKLYTTVYGSRQVTPVVGNVCDLIGMCGSHGAIGFRRFAKLERLRECYKGCLRVAAERLCHHAQGLIHLGSVG